MKIAKWKGNKTYVTRFFLTKMPWRTQSSNWFLASKYYSKRYWRGLSWYHFNIFDYPNSQLAPILALCCASGYKGKGVWNSLATCLSTEIYHVQKLTQIQQMKYQPQFVNRWTAYNVLIHLSYGPRIVNECKPYECKSNRWLSARL